MCFDPEEDDATGNDASEVGVPMSARFMLVGEQFRVARLDLVVVPRSVWTMIYQSIWIASAMQACESKKSCFRTECRKALLFVLHVYSVDNGVVAFHRSLPL